MWQQSGRMRTADDQHSGFLIGSNRITGCVPLPSHLPDPILSPPSCFSHSHLAPDLFSLLSTPLTPFPLFPPTSFILSFSSLSASPECALNFDIKKKEKRKKSSNNHCSRRDTAGLLSGPNIFFLSLFLHTNQRISF